MHAFISQVPPLRRSGAAMIVPFSEDENDEELAYLGLSVKPKPKA